MPKNDFNPKTVTIGSQVWTAENLNVDDGGEGIYHNLDNNETYYSWEAAMRVAKNIPGWHLPTALEWDEAALACGAKGVSYEGNPNYNDYEDAQVLKDRLGVKLVGGQYLGSLNLGSNAYFWATTEHSSAFAYYRRFSTGALVDSDYTYKTDIAYSVRLVKEV